jgi:hypothetical protein
LDDRLKGFYAGSRKTDGTQFKKTALQSIRYGVKKHIVETHLSFLYGVCPFHLQLGERNISHPLLPLQMLTYSFLEDFLVPFCTNKTLFQTILTLTFLIKQDFQTVTKCMKQC